MKSQVIAAAKRWQVTALDKYAGEVVAALLETTADEKQSDVARVAAAAQLMDFQTGNAEFPSKLVNLVTAKASPELVQGLMEQVARSTSGETGEILATAVVRFTPSSKSRAIKVLLTKPEWTGVLLSTLLKECGLKGSATWFVAEGSEEVKGASSMPVAKAMDDCFIAYGMNGEAVRPQNGFPLRLMVPGFEGIFHTKWLQRIKLVDRYYMNYNDFGHLEQNEKVAALAYQIGPKSVITYPSGEQRLPGKGFYEIRGLAWSGGGAIKQVEVSTDGGKKWSKAQFQGTPQRMAHCLFTYPWNWDGTETEIMSRCVDEIGQAQPTREQIARHWNRTFDQTFSVPGLDNSIQPWRIASDGSVTNGFA